MRDPIRKYRRMAGNKGFRLSKRPDQMVLIFPRAASRIPIVIDSVPIQSLGAAIESLPNVWGLEICDIIELMRGRKARLEAQKRSEEVALSSMMKAINEYRESGQREERLSYLDRKSVV